MRDFQIVLVDDPWKHNDRREFRRDNPERKSRFGIGVQRRYTAGTMSYENLVDVTPFLEPHLRKDAYLFMWATCPLLPQAVQLMAARGFIYKTVCFVWVKNTVNGKLFFGPGKYTGSNVELLLLGRKAGQKCWHSTAKGCYKPPQVVFAPQPRDENKKIIHSRKPEIFQDLIEDWLGPYRTGGMLELFATRERPGWACLGHSLSGNDIRHDLNELQKGILL